MATRMRDARARAMQELRFEPTEKRVRATLGERTATDSNRAVLVWEPRRVLPSYAVPVEDLRGELLPISVTPQQEEPTDPPPILHGGFPFGVHSTEGEPLSVRIDGETLEDSAFRAADTDLAGYVVLDFHAFDGWYEEDESI